MNTPSNGLVNWFRNPFTGDNHWLSMFDWNSPGNSLLSDIRIGADLHEDADSYLVRMEVPGVNRKELNVELENAVLTVSYEQKSHGEDGSESRRSFRRSVSIPDGFVADKVSAELKDGILTVTVPKAETSKPKRIKVN
ncbi:MAG: Hsp20/alpha crystallin family protein [Akkermansiaceae bacterium]|nr:Hsp20/alpha crystallin family protein [Akkermansiaceae bacterium]